MIRKATERHEGYSYRELLRFSIRPVALRHSLLLTALALACFDLPASAMPTATPAGTPSPSPTPYPDAIYEANYQSNTIEVFSLAGSDLGTFGTPVKPTGLAFDNAGNLYVSSDDGPNRVYSLLKFAPDGSFSVFANSGLASPHALVFDRAGNLYVANNFGNTIEKFTPDGVGTVFANANDGLAGPLDLAWDTEGNLYVSNAYGGSTRTGSILKFTPDGVGSVFTDSGSLQVPFGLAFDSAGNIYVSNYNSSTI